MFLVPDGAEVLLLSQHVCRAVNVFVMFVAHFLFLITIVDPNRFFLSHLSILLFTFQHT